MKFYFLLLCRFNLLCRVILVIFLLISFFYSAAQQPRLIFPIGHSDEISFAQFSPDGSRVITASDDKTAKIWDAETGAMLAELKGHIDVVSFAYFSPDGKKILTVSGSHKRRSEDYVIKIWDAVTGKWLVNLPHSSQAVSARFSPDGKQIVSVATDNHAHVWDVFTYKKLFTLSGHSSTVNSASFSADGKKIITGSEDRTAIIWDAQRGTKLITLEGRGYHPLSNALFSPDEKKIITIHKNNWARIWDAKTNKVLDTLIFVNNAQFSPDGKLIVTTFDKQRVKTAVVWDAEKGKAINNLPHWGAVNTAFFSPDGNTIVTSSDDGTCKIWDRNKVIDTGRVIPDEILEGHQDRVLYAQFSNDNKRVLTASGDGTAMVWTVKDGGLISHLKGHTEIMSTAVFSPDGNTILTASQDGSAKSWDMKTGKLQASLSGYGGLYAAGYSPDGKRIITASADSISRIWDAETGILIKEMKQHYHEVLTASFSPAGNKIVTVSKDKTARIWDDNGNEILFELKKHYREVNAAQFSADGKKLVTASSDNTAIIWNTETGQPIHTLTGHSYFLTSAAFSPDGKRVVTGSFDKTIRIWNAETGDSLYTINKHTDRVHVVGFSSDGSKIFSASEDGTLKIWDAVSFEKKSDITVDLEGVNYASFSPDGTKIIATSWNNICYIFESSTGNKLLTFFAVDSIDYIVADKDSRYDGTQAARELLYFTCGTEVIKLSQVKDPLWVPGLAEMVLKGEPVTAKKLSELSICSYSPVIKDTVLANGDYRFKIIPRGGKLGETVVSVNGIETKRYKPSEIKNRKGEFEVVVKKNDLDSIIARGRENPVSVKAFTADNTVSSRGGVVRVNNTENANVGPAANLYAVFAGVSNYKGDSIDLNFAAKDAKDFSDAIALSAAKFLNKDGKEHVFIYNLTTNSPAYRQPSKKNIRSILDSIGRKATANDMLLIFFAGHGTMAAPAKNEQFYFLTSDASSLTNTNAFKDVAISTPELIEWLKPQKMKAQQRVLIFDACSSGQALTDFTRLGAVMQTSPARPAATGNQRAQQEKNIDKLNEKSGFFILSAAASGKDAYEIPALSQGLLTYSLLNSVKLFPEVLEDNKYLNIGRWFNSAEKTVIEISEEKKKEQRPQMISHNNFSIGVVDDEVRGKISIPVLKPVFGASNFQNRAEVIPPDDLNLSNILNMQLTNVSSRGAGSKIFFVTATNSPDAFNLSGRYTVTGDSVSVTVNIIRSNERPQTFIMTGNKNDLNKLAADIVLEAANRAAASKNSN